MKKSPFSSRILSFAVALGVFAASFGLARAIGWPTTPAGEIEGGKIGHILHPDVTSEKLGIGTYNPTGRLNIVGTSGTKSLTAASTDGAGADCSVGEERVPLDPTSLQVGFMLETATITTVGADFVCIDDNSVAWTLGSIKEWKDPATDVVVDTTGNLGIKTDSPQEALDVSGAVKLGDTTGANEGTIRFNTSTTDFEGYTGAEWLSLTIGGGNCAAEVGDDGSGGFATDTVSVSCPAGKRLSYTTVEWESNPGIYSDYFGITYNLTNDGANANCLGNGCKLHAICCEGASGGVDTLGTLFCLDGQIPKWDFNNTIWVCSDDEASGSFWAQNASDIYYTAGKVGIGTTSPAQALHVKTASGNAEIAIQSGLDDYWGIYQDETSKDLNFWNTNSDNLLTLTDEGNVGVGTTSPGGLLGLADANTYLDVDGSNNLTFTDAVSGTKTLAELAAAGGDFADGGEAAGAKRTLGNTDDYDLGFLANGERMTIDSATGNVGIGTTSPYSGSKLHVEGTTYSTKGFSAKSGTGNSRYGLKYGSAGNVGDSDLLMLTNREVNGELAFATDDGTGGGTGETERMRIDNNGYVGINTTSPNLATLEVYEIPGASTIAMDAATNGNANMTFRAAGVDKANIRYYEQEDTLELYHATTGSPGLNIDSSNNVGIGTTSPGTTLEVAGVGNSAQARITAYSSTYTNWQGTPSLSIFKSHNNTVGTLTPTVSGELLGQITFGGVNTANSFASQGAINVTQTGSAGAGGWANPTKMSFYVSNGSGTSLEALDISSSGNVGIGTTSPGAKLEVNGNARISSTSPAITEGTMALVGNETTGAADTGAGLTFLGNDGSADRSWATIQGMKENGTVGNFASYLRFSTRANGVSQTEQMRISSSGNVGIGTTSPSEKLEVNGNVKATAFLQSSDIRLKEDIQPIESKLSELWNVHGVSFSWKATKQKSIGFIAQEVEKYFPELVATDPVTGLKSIQYDGFIPLLLEALRAQGEELQATKEKLNTVEIQMNDLQKRVEELEHLLHAEEI